MFLLNVFSFCKQWKEKIHIQSIFSICLSVCLVREVSYKSQHIFHCTNHVEHKKYKNTPEHNKIVMDCKYFSFDNTDSFHLSILP